MNKMTTTATRQHEASRQTAVALRWLEDDYSHCRHQPVQRDRLPDHHRHLLLRSLAPVGVGSQDPHRARVRAEEEEDRLKENAKATRICRDCGASSLAMHDA
jgi:hypothetical protein